MSRRDELMKKNQNIRSTAEISESEVLDAKQNHRPRSGQGSFAQRQRLEDRIRELEGRLGESEGRMIRIEDISTNPWQPRRIVDNEELQKLAMSIGEIGLVQPIIVRSVSNRDTGFEIIAGERRYRAHQILGRDAIKAIVLDVPDADMAAFALAENIARADLTAYEIAVAIRNAEQLFPSKTSLASSLGLNRTAVYKYLAFFKLPSFIIADLEDSPGLLGRDAADSIASLLGSGGDQALLSLQAIWPRVKAGDLDQGKIVSTIEVAMKNRGAVRSGRDIKKLFVGSEQAGTITRDDSALTVKIRAVALTPEKEAELRSVVERMFS
jgi:ParB family chromosome partitioning protein